MWNVMQSGKLKMKVDREKWGKIGKIETFGKSGNLGKSGKLGICKKLTKFTNFNEEMKWK